MLTNYLQKKLDQAKYRILKDGTYFGEIPGLKGVWADAVTLDDCRKELQEVLEEWCRFQVPSEHIAPLA